MAEDFKAAVEDGLRLSKRVYFGQDRTVAPPKPQVSMERGADSLYLPTSPMVYAVIIDPAIVDNPDMPSYQPHVHGRCDPPALIPLHMSGVALEVDCYLDTAIVTVTGTWRVHCVMGNRTCDCRIAVPMGERGSILGVDVEVPKKSYHTQVIADDNEKGTKKVANTEDGGFFINRIFTLTIPQIHGGTNISVKLSWSQKLLYHDGDFTLNIPFSFPEYIIPAAKKLSKREKIQLNVNAGPGTEVLCRATSHPLKEKLRKAGKLFFLYDAEVISWSSSDFMFTYSISSSHTFGGVILNPPALNDVDRRDTFCCYLFPGKQKVFRREVVFVVDISGSMGSKLLEEIKHALFTALAKLSPEDLFNVIAFNNATCLFSSSMEPATAEIIEKVTQWIDVKFISSGGTDILLPLDQAVQMLSDAHNSLPIIFLITDGAVEDEKHICDFMEKQLSNRKNICPRIFTLGIGTFCNHYFLRMLTIIGRGHHEAAIDTDSVEVQIGRLFARASIMVADITFSGLDELNDLEVFPSKIPDLSSGSPLIVSGRYRGTFPETVKLRGILADMGTYLLDLNADEVKEIPIGKIVAKEQIDLLTAQAWYSDNKELELKIAKMSVQNGIVSEYTDMVFHEEEGKTGADSTTVQKVSSKGDKLKTECLKPQKTIVLNKMRIGFGNLAATAENLTPGLDDAKPPDAAEIFVKRTSNLCGKVFGPCCCFCCIQACSRVNDQCAIVLTQLCGALACLGCYACCEACCGGQDG